MFAEGIQCCPFVAVSMRTSTGFRAFPASQQNFRGKCEDDVAVEYDFLDPTCCQYDPAFKLNE
jgi:hypothetical protein